MSRTPLIPVEGSPGLYRNSSGAIINCDERERQRVRRARELHMRQINRINSQKNEINNLRDEVSELKQLVNKLVEKIGDK
jgi:hypothetical protein